MSKHRAAVAATCRIWLHRAARLLKHACTSASTNLAPRLLNMPPSPTLACVECTQEQYQLQQTRQPGCRRPHLCCHEAQDAHAGSWTMYVHTTKSMCVKGVMLSLPSTACNTDSITCVFILNLSFIHSAQRAPNKMTRLQPTLPGAHQARNVHGCMPQSAIQTRSLGGV